MGVGVIATDISDLRQYSEKAQNVVIVEGSLEKAMEKYVAGMSGKKKNRVLCDLFDYRKWTKTIGAFIE